MKAAFLTLLLLILALVILGLAGCATVVTHTVTTDKAGTVTETTTTSRSTDRAALSLAGSIATAYAPRGLVIREEKDGTPADLQRILRRQPITKQEIAHRWQPVTR